MALTQVTNKTLEYIHAGRTVHTVQNIYAPIRALLRRTCFLSYLFQTVTASELECGGEQTLAGCNRLNGRQFVRYLLIMQTISS